MPLFAPPKLTETYTTTFFLPSSSTESYVSPISNLLLSDGNGGTYFTTFPTVFTLSTINSVSISTTFLSVATQVVSSINIGDQSFINSTDIRTSNIFLSGAIETSTLNLVNNISTYSIYVDNSALFFNGTPIAISKDDGGLITFDLSNILTSTISITDTLTLGQNPAFLYTTDDGIHIGYNETSALITSTIKTQNISLSNYNEEYDQPFIVAVGSDRMSANQIQSSTDGSNWSPSFFSFNSGSYPTGIAYNGSLWVATVANGATSLLYSTDARTWSAGSGGFDLLVNSVAWGNGLWLAFGLDSTGTSILKSLDGSNWEPSVESGGFTSGANSGAWNNTIWVAVGTGPNSIQWSPDGCNWSPVIYGGFSGSGRCVSWNGSYWLAGGYDTEGLNTIQKSQEGFVWAQSFTAHLTQVNCLAWNGTRWMAGGELTGDTTLETSEDGSVWTPVTVDFPGDCYGITWLNSWVATGGDSVKKTIKTSIDGLTWNDANTGGFSDQGYAIASMSYIVPAFTYFTEISPSYMTTSNITTNTVTLNDASNSIALSSHDGILYYGVSPVFTNNGSVSYINTVAESIPSLTYTPVNWNSIDTRQSYGLTNISNVGTSFSNYSMNVLCVSVSGYIGWDIGGTAGSSRNVYAFLNGVVADMNSCLSYSSIPAPSDGIGGLNPVVNFSFNTILNPSDYFDIYVYHNDLEAQEINTQVALPGSRITIFVK